MIALLGISGCFIQPFYAWYIKTTLKKGGMKQVFWKYAGKTLKLIL